MIEKAVSRTQHTPMCAMRLVVDIAAPEHTVEWAQSLRMQEKSVDRERTTEPRDLLVS